jgi:hypothetical protein
MHPLFLATVTGVLLAAPFGAQARQSVRSPDPSNPGAPVPALAYESALRGYARFPGEATVSPDQSWRRANDALAGTAGEGKHDKQGPHDAGHGSAGSAQAAPPAAPDHGHGHAHQRPTPATQ